MKQIKKPKRRDHLIQPGENRNPIGGAAHDKDKLLRKDLTHDQFISILKNLLYVDRHESSLIDDNPRSTLFELAINKCLANAAMTGDIQQLLQLFERIYGKVPQGIKIEDMQILEEIRAVRAIPREQVFLEMKQAVEVLERASK